MGGDATAGSLSIGDQFDFMQLTFHCPVCRRENRAETCRPEEPVRCAHCAWERSAAAADLVQDRPGRCLVCGNEDLWRQKDFPRGLGLTIVVAGAVFSSIAWYFHMPKTALGVLMAIALGDMLLFAVMPDVLVCYRCQAKHCGAQPAADHPAFDHELAERYRQEQLRLQHAAREKTTLKS